MLVAGDNVGSSFGLRGWPLGKFDFARDSGGVEALVARTGLARPVTLTGFAPDLPSLYAARRLVLPVHLDLPGRPVSRQRWSASLVDRSREEPSDRGLFIADRTGICIASDPCAIADAIERRRRIRRSRTEMGDQARSSDRPIRKAA